MVSIDKYRVKLGSKISHVDVICGMVVRGPERFQWARGLNVEKFQEWIKDKGGSIKKL